MPLRFLILPPGNGSVDHPVLHITFCTIQKVCHVTYSPYRTWWHGSPWAPTTSPTLRMCPSSTPPGLAWASSSCPTTTSMRTPHWHHVTTSESLSKITTTRSTTQGYLGTTCRLLLNHLPPHQSRNAHQHRESLVALLYNG